jgi:hypothetical protein
MDQGSAIRSMPLRQDLTISLPSKEGKSLDAELARMAGQLGWLLGNQSRVE